MEPEVEVVEIPLDEDLPLDIPAPSWLDSGLDALGLPGLAMSLPLLGAAALLSVTLTEILKNASRRPEGTDTARWQWQWRAVAVSLATLAGVLLALAGGRVELLQGALLGLAGGLASPLIWRLVIPYLRGGKT
jgi:hypothetical protein